MRIKLSVQSVLSVTKNELRFLGAMNFEMLGLSVYISELNF